MTNLTAAIEAGARAHFDRGQARRMDAARTRPDGLRWTWDDVTEHDRAAERAFVAPIVTAVFDALTKAAKASPEPPAGSQGDAGHEGAHGDHPDAAGVSEATTEEQAEFRAACERRQQ
jgi:hypothetical protein